MVYFQYLRPSIMHGTPKIRHWLDKNSVYPHAAIPFRATLKIIPTMQHLENKLRLIRAGVETDTHKGNIKSN